MAKISQNLIIKSLFTTKRKPLPRGCTQGRGLLARARGLGWL